MELHLELKKSEIMNENLNLVKILKDCPKGTKLYTPIIGEVELYKIHENNNSSYPINVIYNNENEDEVFSFTKDGRFDKNAPINLCLLFPSKNQYDWSKFKCSKPKFDPNTLKPFDKVLVRDSSDRRWRCAIFSHVRKEDENYTFKYVTTACTYEFCIPYNEDTAYLVGAKDEAPKYYRYWEN